MIVTAAVSSGKSCFSSAKFSAQTNIVSAEKHIINNYIALGSESLSRAFGCYLHGCIKKKQNCCRCGSFAFMYHEESVFSGF